jgi:hypothetical protein
LSTSQDNTARLWDVASGDELHQFRLRPRSFCPSVWCCSLIGR